MEYHAIMNGVLKRVKGLMDANEDYMPSANIMNSLTNYYKQISAASNAVPNQDKINSIVERAINHANKIRDESDSGNTEDK